MKKHILKKSNFYHKSNIEDFCETFLLKAEDRITLDNHNMDSVMSGIYFQLQLEKQQNNLVATIELFSWSNEKQKNVPLEKSFWVENEFGGEKNISLITKHYTPIIDNFLTVINTFKYHWQLKDLIYKIKNPVFIFHYKLLNLFTQQELEDICLTFFNNIGIFNTVLYKSSVPEEMIDYTILPHMVNGFYINGFEVSVDLNKTDLPLLECDNLGVISKEQFLEKLYQSRSSGS